MNDFKWEEILSGAQHLLFSGGVVIGSVGLVTHQPVRWKAWYNNGVVAEPLPNTENFEQLNDAKQALENWITNNK